MTRRPAAGPAGRWLGGLALAGLLALAAGCSSGGDPGQSAPATAAPPATVPATSAPTTAPPTTAVPTTAAPTTRPVPRVTTRRLGLPPPAGWRPAGRPVDGRPAVYLASVGGVGVAWADMSRLRAQLIAGAEDPGGPGKVAVGERAKLVAAFNSGFKLAVSLGGYSAGGRVVVPLVRGAASFVIRPDGAVSIGAWGTQVGPWLHPLAVRQNLTLLVNGGRPTPAVAAAGYLYWGATLGGGIDVWRSAVGVRPDGALLFAAGSTTPLGLADALVAAGATRAMELDINPYWVSFDVYRSESAGLVGIPVLGSGEVGADRYLYPWSRDFIALLGR